MSDFGPYKLDADPFLERIDEIAARDPERQTARKSTATPATGELPELKAPSGAVYALRQSRELVSEFGPDVLGEDFGIEGLNHIAGRYARPGRLITCAAPTGVGKSIVLTQVSSHVASRGGGVLYVSLEMSAHEVVQRMAAQVSHLPASWFEEGIPDHELADRPGLAAEMEAAEQRVRDLPLLITDEPALTVEQVCALARQAAATLPNFRMVAVDYLTLLNPSEGTERTLTTYQIGHMLKELKALAQRLGIVVLIAAQVNRESSKGQAERRYREPILSDLSDSSYIEKTSDTVLFIHDDLTSLSAINRDRIADQVPSWDDDPSLHAFIVAKQRKGPRGVCVARLVADQQRFVDPDRSVHAPYTPPSAYSETEKEAKSRIAEIMRL